MTYELGEAHIRVDIHASIRYHIITVTVNNMSDDCAYPFGEGNASFRSFFS